MIGSRYTPPVSRLEQRRVDGSFSQVLPPMSYDSERIQSALLRGPVPARRHVVAVLLVYATAIAAYVML